MNWDILYVVCRFWRKKLGTNPWIFNLEISILVHRRKRFKSTFFTYGNPITGKSQRQQRFVIPN